MPPDAPVLHLTRDLPPATTSGLSTATWGLATAQAQTGRPVSCLSFDGWRPRARAASGAPPPSPRLEEGLHVLRVTTPADLPAAAAFLAAQAPATLHVHDAMLWPVAAAARATHGVPAVLQVHVLHSAMNAVRGVTAPTLSHSAQADALATADAVLAPSRCVAALLLAAHPELAPRLGLAGLGHLPPPAATRPAPADPARRPFVYVGRFDDVKGLPDLFAALPSLLERFPEAHAVLAGGLPGNPRAEARWRDRWRASVSADVAARTRFAGWLAPDALDALYRVAAVVLVPSRFETFGQVALEAMARGAAVVATDAGALPELLVDGVTGLLVPTRSPDSLAAAAAALYAAPDRARALGRAAAQSALAWRWPALLPAYDRGYALATRVRREHTNRQ